MTSSTRKVAIVARGSTRHSAPFRDRRWEIWGLPWISYPWCDRAYEVHEQSFYDDMPNNWLKKQAWIERFEKDNPQADVYCVKSRMHQFKNAIEFPMDGVLSSLPRKYVENSLAIMIAHAIFENDHSSLYGAIEEIGLWGVHMYAGPEADIATASVAYLIGLAEGRGIKVTQPPGSPLLMSSYVDGRYGVRGGKNSLRPKFLCYADAAPYL